MSDPKHPLECQLELQAACDLHNVMRERALRAERRIDELEAQLKAVREEVQHQCEKPTRDYRKRLLAILGGERIS